MRPHGLWPGPYTGRGAAYNQLLAGLGVLALSVLGSALFLGRLLFAWSRRIGQIEAALARHNERQEDLPTLSLTGERELDRLVSALNQTTARLAEMRRHASAAERLAAVGRLAAGMAHEIRNPIAAMRLKPKTPLRPRERIGQGPHSRPSSTRSRGSMACFAICSR
jgi:C4-dicarboxylate-specific signal transduction histidine kinase